MLGTRLKALRIKKNLTQKQLAEKINVTNVSVSGYESGNRTPDTDTLQLIADFFEVSTDYLLGRSNHPQLTAEKDLEVDAEVDELMKILEAMPLEERKEMEARILAYAQGLADAKKRK
ncbi:helix-turn-helix transcriptional regulator [Metasolibacillus meyeri]|uniref:Helix-turn-helix transcriptional regulator n=1 Tax=Metasolibacillus meyeri TaxID=1071052 RepID=A0AAW9NJP7_9BACL|nr:helix-turn-helix transcriptional regulator [Metasolibacillus meyeri]MEC1177307.1 helix-turn-helix transcriptional regulator [Metasolibacillus meyeri]